MVGHVGERVTVMPAPPLPRLLRRRLPHADPRPGRRGRLHAVPGGADGPRGGASRKGGGRARGSPPPVRRAAHAWCGSGAAGLTGAAGAADKVGWRAGGAAGRGGHGQGRRACLQTARSWPASRPGIPTTVLSSILDLLNVEAQEWAHVQVPGAQPTPPPLAPDPTCTVSLLPAPRLLDRVRAVRWRALQLLLELLGAGSAPQEQDARGKPGSAGLRATSASGSCAPLAAAQREAAEAAARCCLGEVCALLEAPHGSPLYADPPTAEVGCSLCVCCACWHRREIAAAAHAAESLTACLRLV